VNGNFLPFKGKSHSLSSQAARFFYFAKGIFPLLQRNPAHMTRANASFHAFFLPYHFEKGIGPCHVSGNFLPFK
jgi:hypothetical protein